jgi:hypothetical protein
MEHMGLQQELYGSHFTRSPRQSRSEQPTLSQFYPCEEMAVDDDLLSYQESDDQPASFLSYPLSPLGTVGNPIVISDNKDNIKSSLSHPSYHEA